MSKVYVVGDKNAPKTNSWDSMTNSLEEAERLVKELGPQATMKEVKVPPPRRRK
jgi:hypothetical protein